MTLSLDNLTLTTGYGTRDYSADPRDDRKLRFLLDAVAEDASKVGATYISRILSNVASRYRVTHAATVAAFEEAFDETVRLNEYHLPVGDLPTTIVHAKQLVAAA